MYIIMKRWKYSKICEVVIEFFKFRKFVEMWVLALIFFFKEQKVFSILIHGTRCKICERGNGKWLKFEVRGDEGSERK